MHFFKRSFQNISGCLFRIIFVVAFLSEKIDQAKTSIFERRVQHQEVYFFKQQHQFY